MMGAPVWMLRINPMARQRLADPYLTALLEEAARLDQAIRALAAAASDDLYDLVPDVPQARRGRILALRRDIHNGRRPADPMAEETGVDWPASVIRWGRHEQRRQDCEAQIRAAHDGALARERSLLRERLGEGNFLTTLAQSAPGVYDAACRYRRHGETAADAKDRKAERSLVQYVTRAMVRTSPYGRFTAVGLAAPLGGMAMDEVTPDTARPVVEVDRAMFDYVMGGLVTPSAERDPLMALPPTARVGDEAITFFQVRPDALRRLSAPLTRQTRLLVELLDLGPCPRSMLAGALAERLTLPPSEAERLIDVALGLGLLVTAWRGDQFVAEPVEQALRDLAANGADPPPQGLRLFRAELNRLGDGAERGATLRRLDDLGDGISRLARRPAKLMVNEDYVLDPLLVDPGIHGPALDDLTAVAELLTAFDRMHVLRGLVAATLVERFGPGCRVPLVAHAEALVRAAYQGERVLAEHPDAPLGPADGSLAILAKVRQEALTALQRDLDGADADEDADGEVCWAPGDLAALVAGMPERFRAEPACYGMVVQPHQGDLIVNDTYAGHGPMVSRFLHADSLRGGDGVARLRERLRLLYGTEMELLEDRGHHNLSINAHPPILDRGLDPDGWRRLRLAHDADTDAVSIVDSDGARVKVLALGAQLPELFPYPVRLATWLCSSGRVVLDVADKLHRQRDARGGDGLGPTTVAYRRLRVGGVIVSRRRWYPGADFPPPGGGAEYLLAVNRWRGRHGVPAEVMLRSLFDGPTMWESLSNAASRDRFFELRSQSKPQYVDLASALMARLLPRFLERRPEGCVEEARPSLAEGGHASEWMVEVSRPAGRTRFDWRATG